MASLASYVYGDVENYNKKKNWKNAGLGSGWRSARNLAISAAKEKSNGTKAERKIVEEDLEAYLNAVASNIRAQKTDNDKDYSSSVIKSVEDRVQKAAQELAGSAYGSYNVGKNSLSYSSNFATVTKTSANREKGNTVALATIEKKIKQIQDFYNNPEWRTLVKDTKGKTLSEVGRTLRDLKAKLKIIISNAKAEGIAVDNKTRLVSKKDGTASEKGVYSLLGQMNTFVDKYFDIACKAYVDGISFENFAAAALQSTSQGILNEIASSLGGDFSIIIDGAKKIGSGTSNVNMTTNKTTHMTGGSIDETTTMSKVNKTDVQMQVSIKGGRTQDYNLSLKNYNFGGASGVRYISLVSGTPLDQLLSGQGITQQYKNHFINIGAFGSKAIRAEDMMFDAGMVMLAKAIQGYDDTKAVDFFVVNNKTTGRIEVKDINDLLQNVLEHANGSLKNLATVTVGDKENILWGNGIGFLANHNTWVGDKNVKSFTDAQERSANAIKAYQQLRASVKIKYIFG